MKENSTYKNALADACRNLAEGREKIFSDLVNVAMSGEYGDINGKFEIGELVEFMLDDFRGADDTNVQKLYRLIRDIERCRESLININGLGGSGPL